MHFGLEPYIPLVLYASAIICILLSVFWRPIIGIYYLLPLIPLQTIRYRLNDLPLGASIVGLMLLAVALGVLRGGKPLLVKTPWTRIVCIYAVFTFVSLCVGSSHFSRPAPLPGDSQFAFWQEYMLMPALLLLTAAVSPTKKQIQIIVLIMCAATVLLDKSFWDVTSDRDFSTYSEELHEEGGSMGYAGTNGLAAYAAQVTALLLALAAFERRKWLRLAYYSVAWFSVVCLTYSLSRAGYVAVVAGVLVIGLFKQRILLLLLIIFCLVWTSVVPGAVQQRVLMTYDDTSGTLDNSTQTRLSLWTDAVQVFQEYPVMGTGFNTYSLMNLNRRTDGSDGYYKDTHNYFVKVIVETGIAGMALFLSLVLATWAAGFRLFRRAKDPFFASLGLGLMGWLTCALVANLFGDRWTFLQVNGYMWVLAGLVSQAMVLEQRSTATSVAAATPATPLTGDIPLIVRPSYATALADFDDACHDI